MSVALILLSENPEPDGPTKLRLPIDDAFSNILAQWTYSM